MIDLLVVRLHDEFAERTAAVSVNLEQMKPNKTLTRTINGAIVETMYSRASFYTQGLTSPNLKASMTSFRQSPMSW